MENFCALDPLAHGKYFGPQKGKWRPGGIQAAKPPPQRGGRGHTIGVFHRGRRRFQRTAFHEVVAQRLTTGDKAVVGIGERERRQNGECLLAETAMTAANIDPDVVFIVRLFVAAAMADNGIAVTNGAMPGDLR